MLRIWIDSLPPSVDALQELTDALEAINKRKVAGIVALFVILQNFIGYFEFMGNVSDRTHATKNPNPLYTQRPASFFPNSLFPAHKSTAYNILEILRV